MKHTFLSRSLLLTLCLCLVSLLFTFPATATEQAVCDEGRVTGGKLHLRAEPSASATILATYDNGTKVQILSEQDGWYHVRLSNGDSGYMDSRYILACAQGQVNNHGDYVNLRKSPGEDSEILGRFSTGTSLTVLSTSGNWSHVEIQGVEGYMLSSLISGSFPDQQSMILGSEASETETEGAAATQEPMDMSPAVENPYTLETDGDTSVVHQAGESQTRTSFEEDFYYMINYPVLNIVAADDAIEAWVQDIIAAGQAMQAETTDEDAVEVETQYDTYRVDDQYVGVLQTGFMNSRLLAHPTDIIESLNVDTRTGALYRGVDLIVPEQMDTVLSLLRQELTAIEPDPMTADVVVDESWLEHVVLMPEGLAVVLPKGEHLASVYGTVRVVLSYDMLNAGGMLSIAVQGVAPADPLESTPAPVQAAEPADQEATTRVIDPTKPMIALTFDDGPSDYTESILAILEAHDARATFCVIGNRVENYQDVVRAIEAQGSEIATHTWSHKDLTKLSRDAVHWQLSHSMEAIEAITGEPVRVLRPPYGSVNATVREVSRELGLTIATWSVDTEDWKTGNADSTYNAIMRHATNGAIILCHDSHHSTANAMERVIPALVEQGYQLVTVSELLSFSQTQGEPGVVYNHLDTSHLTQ